MIVGITGKMGSGKTLLMSIFGFSFTKEVPVYSNYETTFSRVIKSLKELISITDGIILIDEIHLQLDARLWFTKEGVKFTHWVNQTRKKNLILFYTSQHFKQVDIRLRRATDLLIHSLNFGYYFKYLFIDPASEYLLKIIRVDKEKMKPFFQIYNTFEFIYPLR